jgi:uncharacterized damage-inducible protein DinB
MFCTIEDFVTTWHRESEATLKIFHHLTDDSLNIPLIPEYRTIGELSNHLIGLLYRFSHQAGLAISPKPGACSSVADLTKAYTALSTDFLRLLQSSWTDAMLDDKISMFGREWTREFALSTLVLHQTHHRAQITVLMRMASLKVPGLYGPSREERGVMNKIKDKSRNRP